jgi:hypothetical protein
MRWRSRSSSSTISARGLEALLDEEATVEDGTAAIGHAGGLDGVGGLAAHDGVDVEGGPGRARGHDRHARHARGQRRQQLGAHGLEQRAHVLERAYAQEGHAAVGDAPAQQHLEPVHAAVPDADAVHVERLRDDHVVGAPGPHPALAGQPGHDR